MCVFMHIFIPSNCQQVNALTYQQQQEQCKHTQRVQFVNYIVSSWILTSRQALSKNHTSKNYSTPVRNTTVSQVKGRFHNNFGQHSTRNHVKTFHNKYNMSILIFQLFTTDRNKISSTQLFSNNILAIQATSKIFSLCNPAPPAIKATSKIFSLWLGFSKMSIREQMKCMAIS